MTKERGMSYIHKHTGEEILLVPNLHIEFGDEDFSDDGNFTYVMGWALEGMRDFDNYETYTDLKNRFKEYKGMSLEDRATITHEELSRLIQDTDMRLCDWSYIKTYDVYAKRDGTWEKTSD